MSYTVTTSQVGPVGIFLPTSPRKRRENYDASPDKIVPWGEDNLYPQRIYEAGKANSLIPAVIEKQIGLIAGSGFTYGTPKRGPEGLELEFKTNPKLEAYLSEINLDAYILDAFSDLLWFGNVFPEIVKHKGEIAAVRVQEAMFCRFHKQAKSGLLTKVAVNANWDQFASDSDDDTTHISLLQRYGVSPVNELRSSKEERFIYPISVPSPGAVFYQLRSWHSAEESGWLPYANKLVAVNNAILDNQISIKYVIEINQKYWKLRWSDFDEKPGLQETRIAQVKKEIEDGLTGVDNAGKAIFTPSILNEFDENATVAISLITITPLKDFLKGGDNIGSSQEAAAHLCIALGMPAALLGNTPGNGGNGANSGSNIYEALRLLLQHFSIYSKIILEPLNRLVLPYMGFTEKIELLQPAMLKREALSPENR